MFACFAQKPVNVQAAGYTRDAVLRDGEKYPGVYYVKAEPADSSVTDATIGIPSLDKNTLAAPTTESPAKIMGAAVPYEVKTGPVEFTPIEGGALYPPYSYFPYNIIEEQGPDGTWHKKMSGFDGTYFIIRVDVSDLIKDAPEGSYLHVKQEGNKALMALLKYEKYNAAENPGKGSFSDALGNIATVYAIDNGAIALKDKEGYDQGTPYVDVIVYSSGTLVAGADTGSTSPTAQNADFKLKFYIDQTADYNPALDYDPNNQSTTTPTHAEQCLAKFYDESKASGAAVTNYLIKGNDLEIEIMNEAKSPRQFWSLRKAMTWAEYDNSPIKMICEVPVLEGLLVDGHNVIFDVNSFDIQIANHQTTGAAGLTVKNGSLTLMDSFNTTGAELAVGNNASMSIEAGGTLIIDKTCQVEVEYDAASVTPGQGTDPVTYDSGVIKIANGGKIINNGIISIEGTEGKPIDPAAPTIRDMKAAALNVEPGGTLTNNGALVAYGGLYNLGTIENNGRYEDTITSNDPDKGQFVYHCGIQIAWKDDVTQSGVLVGEFTNGDLTNNTATFTNNGDLVLVPGFVDNYAIFVNSSSGAIYLGVVDEAVIPVGVTWSTLIQKQRIGFEKPVAVGFINGEGGQLKNEGNVAVAKVEITGNGSTGELTPTLSDDLAYDYAIDNYGTFTNGGSISLDSLYNYSEVSNSGSVNGLVVLLSNLGAESKVVDNTKALTDIINGAKTVESAANVWKFADCEKITVTPKVQYGVGGSSVSWTLNAASALADAEGVQYYVSIYEGNDDSPKQSNSISANEDITINSPALPFRNGNAVYTFRIAGGPTEEATVKVSSTNVEPPAAVEGLIYNGKEQNLVSAGGTADGKTMQYRLGENGTWSSTVPTAKDAGSYQVYYKLSEDSSDIVPNSVDVEIAKKPATVSGNDASSQKGNDLAELTYTVSGLVGDETLNGVEVTTDADKGTIGTYSVTVTVTGQNPNYEVTAVAGKYSVTENTFVVIAKDKYGVFSDETTYKGFNIELTIPSGATAYYSTAKELTAENYMRDGMTALKNLPTKAGTYTVYYYVTDGTSSASGSKKVIIDKAEQKAPDASKLTTAPETVRGSMDGSIGGLTARAMEYRKKDNDGTYKLAYSTAVAVEPGTYLVRMAADDNHYASPDTEVTVEQGPGLTVKYDVNGGIGTFTDVADLSFGDPCPIPNIDPSMPNAKFLGWFNTMTGAFVDKSTTITGDAVLMASWEPLSVGIIIPDGTTTVEESAFEGMTAMESVQIPAGCTKVGKWAFKGCTNLKQVRIRSNETTFDETAFEDCKNVYIFAPADSPVKALCTEANGFIFVADVQ